MTVQERQTKTGLRRGDLSRIARIHRVTRQHVFEVACSRREGSPKLTATIERYRAKAQQEVAA
jgi:hypothetical protein